MTTTNVFEGTPDARQTGSVTTRTSRFRPVYRALVPEEKALHDAIKAKAAELEALYEQIEPGRYLSLAMTELEASVMWAIKELTGQVRIVHAPEMHARTTPVPTEGWALMDQSCNYRPPTVALAAYDGPTMADCAVRTFHGAFTGDPFIQPPAYVPPVPIGPPLYASECLPPKCATSPGAVRYIPEGETAH